MPQVNTLNGWTGRSISHNADLHDAAHETLSAAVMDTMPQAPSSSVGSVNSSAQLNTPASQLAMTPETLHDPSLGSRGTINPNTGLREAPIVASVSQMGNGSVPDILKQSIANLNAEQTMKRAMQAELVNRIVSGVATGGPNSYLWTEALRSAAVNPGAHVQFNAAVQNPLLGEGYKQAASAYADKTAQQTQALKAANNSAGDIASLQAQRARLGSTVMGANYSNSPQQQLDAKITDAYLAGSPNSATQQLARSVSGPNSGWFSALPTF
jgi:hypothetical protein